MGYRNWIISYLKDHDQAQEIESVIPVGDSLIEIKSKKGKATVVGILEESVITSSHVYNIHSNESKKPNILVARFKCIWHGSAIDYARKNDMGWGGVGEITSAFDTNYYADIQKSEYVFVERNLLRHSKVFRLERLYDRVFKIHRINRLSPITITLINSYELSGDDVRYARDTYGEFDAILKTNPNGNPTGRAYSAAEEIGVEIFKWGELLGRLNRR